MKKSFFILISLLVFSSPAATYYIDWSAGSDANNGTTTNTPWKAAPGMNGFTGTYSHTAGDRFIFKGGVTWPTNMAPWNIANSGAAGNYDYYGVDKTWFTGGSWTRPVFDGGSQYPIPSAWQYGYWVVTGSYLTIDNLTLQNIGVAGTNQGNYAILMTDNHDILVQNMVLAVQSRVAILLSIGTGNTVGNYLFATNDISACSWGICGGPGANTVMTNFVIHHNAFHDFQPQLNNWVHGDCVYMFSAVTNESTYMDGFKIYNNSVYGDFKSGDGTAGMSQYFWASAQMQGSAYIFNNTMSYTQNGDGPACAIGGTAASVTIGNKGNVYVLNNSFSADGNTLKFFSGQGLGNAVILNNIYLGGYGGFNYDYITNIVSDYNDFNGSFLTASSFAFVTTYDGAKISGAVATASPFAAGTGYTIGSTVAPQYGIGGVLQVTGTNSSGGVTGLSVQNGGFGYTGWPYGTTLLSGTGNNDLTLNYSVTPSGIEAHGITNNPLFVSTTNLRLQTNSAAIGAGTNLTAFATAHNLPELLVDADGNPRPSTGLWTIGAYQVADTNSPPPQPPTSGNGGTPMRGMVIW